LVSETGSLVTASSRGESANSRSLPRPKTRVQSSSLTGQAIYDPFLGSGTSLIAAEMAGRICYGLELNPPYVDVIVRRWQVFTGRAATQHASGQSFDERAQRRERDQSGSAHG